MKQGLGRWRLEVPLAISAILGAYWMAAEGSKAAPTRALVSRFAFEATEIPLPQGAVLDSIRAVNPSLAHIDAWISSVGSGAALGDLDGDGRSDDLCLVEPRTDQVLVIDLQELGDPAILDPSPAGYDERTMAPMGCVPHDVNEDGHQDLVVYYWGRPPLVFLWQDGGHLPRPVLVGKHESRMFSNALTFADIDGDGHHDLILGNYFADGGRILDASSDEPQSMQHSMSRAFNGGHGIIARWTEGRDGVGEYRVLEGVLDEEVETGWTLAIGAADLDGDLLPEIYFANDFGPDRMLHNRSTPGNVVLRAVVGAEPIDTPSSMVMGADSFKGMGVDFGDVDGDGRLDVFVSNITVPYALEESNLLYIQTDEPGAWTEGRAPFVERSEARGVARAGWCWDNKIADFDNDGHPELLQATGFVRGEVDRWAELQEVAMGNDELLAIPSSWPRIGPGDELSGNEPNTFFVLDDERYVDIAGPLGLTGPGVSRGIATADIDLDGDLDYVVSNQWAPSVLYRNLCAEGGTEVPCGPSLGLRLRLPIEARSVSEPRVERLTPEHATSGVLGRPAIGASVSVQRSDGLVLVGQIDGGSGHSGVRSPELLFGLPKGDPKASVVVRYRDANGHATEVTLELDSGWYDVLLPLKQQQERVANR